MRCARDAGFRRRTGGYAGGMAERAEPHEDRGEGAERAPDDAAPSDETRRPTWVEGQDEPPRRRPADDEVPAPRNEAEASDEDEPPHLERGSPREDEPAP